MLRHIKPIHPSFYLFNKSLWQFPFTWAGISVIKIQKAVREWNFWPWNNDQCLTWISALLQGPLPLTALGRFDKPSWFYSQELNISCYKKKSSLSPNHHNPHEDQGWKHNWMVHQQIFWCLPRGMRLGTPGWADDRGGGAVQKPEAFRQIWPQAKYGSDCVVFYLLASEPGTFLPPIVSNFSQRGAWHPLWCPEKLKLFPLISTVHFKIGIKAVVKENFILEMVCRAGQPLLWACLKPNLCTEAKRWTKLEEVRLGGRHDFPLPSDLRIRSGTVKSWAGIYIPSFWDSFIHSKQWWLQPQPPWVCISTCWGTMKEKSRINATPGPWKAVCAKCQLNHL